MQISTIAIQNSQFPDLLRTIDNPPTSITVLGNLPKGIHVGIVGTRNCTPYGEKVAYQLASELARAGAVIVSGLAIGIDGIAHQAAVDAGGLTVAVLGNGLPEIYPARHRNLAKSIIAGGGGLISEFEAGMPPLPHNFVQRNRIIAGLCEAVIVIEAPAKSGALITARDAAKFNRQVMAVPGNITSVYSAGPNNLIRTGATPVTSAADVIVELGFHAREATPVPAASGQEAELLSLLGTTAATSDELIEQSGLSPAEFANIISLMEITGKVRNLGAGQWVAR